MHHEAKAAIVTRTLRGVRAIVLAGAAERRRPAQRHCVAGDRNHAGALIR